MNKRAIISFEMLMWIPRILFLVIVMFSVVILIRSFVVEKVDVTELEANIFANRLLYSQNSISFVDEDTERVYPGIIDLTKFNSKEMESLLLKSIFYGDNNRKVGAKITLKNPEDNKDTSLFYNRAFYDEKRTLIDSWGNAKGPGASTSFIKKLDVLILEKSKLHNGILTLDIIIPNS